MRTAVAVLAIASVLVLASPSARADAVSSSHEPRAQVDSVLAPMRATSLRVREQLRTTRKRGTRLQITCVDEALSRSDVALRRARELADEVLAAHARGDAEGAQASFRRLEELEEAQRVAAAAATACTPAIVRVATTTTVKVEISPTIARPL